MTAKINNTAIKIKSLVPRTSKKLSVQRPPGQNSDAIEGLGSQGAELQIELQADTLAEKHLWAAEFLKSGPQVLTDPEGYIYNIVESQASGGRDYTNEPNIDQRWLFGFQCLMEEPYKFSSTEITRLKTITTNGQEWSADDYANAITTGGTIDVIPDIEVVAGALGPDFEREGEVLQDLSPTNYTTDLLVYTLLDTQTILAVEGKAHRIDVVSTDIRNFSAADEAWTKITIQAASLYSGAETTILEDFRTGAAAGYSTYSASPGLTAGNNETVTIRHYMRSKDGSTVASENRIVDYTEMLQAVTKDLTIYNTADTTRKTQVCNEIPPGTTVNINKNGTGSLNYPDDFTTDQYKYVSYDYKNITYDDPNDRITIAGADGYLIYTVDCKFPITGIPTLELNIFSGPVKIAIAENVSGAPGTYYDIDNLTSTNYSTEIVTFLLDNILNFRLKGETSFFLKVYTDGITDLVLNSLTFDAGMVTIDTLLPFVYLGGANTFRADQNSDSSLNATVELSYRDGHWVI